MMEDGFYSLYTNESDEVKNRHTGYGVTDKIEIDNELLFPPLVNERIRPSKHISLLKKRYVSKNTRKIENRIIASYRGKEFYDGKRDNGYGGFKYDGRWQKIAKRIFKHYKLKDNSRILQIGSDKGFLLNDLKKIKPKCTVAGVEISDYAIMKTLKKVKKYVKKSNFYELPFNDNYFDFIIAIGPVYSLSLPDAIKMFKRN